MKVGFPKRRMFSMNTCAPSGLVVRACIMWRDNFPTNIMDRGFFPPHTYQWIIYRIWKKSFSVLWLNIVGCVCVNTEYSFDVL
jgi:hypothetical protein